MEFIFEIIFELIVEGSVEILGEKKVPVFLRVLAAVVVAAVFGGLVVFLVILGVTEKNWVYLAIGAALAVLFSFYIWKTAKSHRS